MTREERLEQKRAQYYATKERDKDKIKERSHQYYLKHKKEVRERVDKWRQANREKYNGQIQRAIVAAKPKNRKNSYLKRVYGMTIETFAAHLENQNNKCGICHKSFSEAKPIVDHNHSTNKVRGLLCTHCNLLLGLAKDNEQILKNAAHYIKTPPAKTVEIR